MNINTKFDPGDSAWYKYDNKWYLCDILDVHFLSYIREITLNLYKELYYKVYFEDITGIPPNYKDRYAYIDEKDLYKNKGSD